VFRDQLPLAIVSVVLVVAGIAALVVLLVQHG
jgi:hypothetical protein